MPAALGDGSSASPASERLLESPTQASMDEQVADSELGGLVMGPGLSQAVACCCCLNVFQCFGWCSSVDQNEQKAVLYWGKYHGTLGSPGMYCINPWGRELRTVSTKFNTMELKDLKVVEARGNPIIVSGVVTYSLSSARKAAVDVENPLDYVRLQATAALKQVAGRYPYTAAPGQPSLQTEGAALAGELVHLVSQKVAVVGALVQNFELVDLSYAPEIAQTMLVKQQAEALVEARRLIVGSAVDMAHHALEQLQSRGGQLSDATRERVTSNLLTVICSNAPATPVVTLQS
mmetsp:Transcript_55986/g.162219  ORF Transcript_55986/g.162219 Transcript_55986/m.162219 type:complete len:291 (+) Transcript_55986:59-931(+)